jgi:hypothetical protein
MSHTPTPWLVERRTIITDKSAAIAYASTSRAMEYAEGNAAHIVRCVNAHDELVAALRAIADSWPAHGSMTVNAIADAMAEKARAALAKAKEST